MANITVRGIEALRATDKEYKVTVDRGLYLRVAIDGSRPGTFSTLAAADSSGLSGCGR